MTEEQKDFEEKYQFKVVRLIGDFYKNLPKKDYIVTSALLSDEGKEQTAIFAIKALDYNLENRQWFTFKIAKNQLKESLSDFEIVEDGFEKYVKPTILDETLLTWEGEEKEEWILRFTSYIFSDRKGLVKFPKKETNKEISVGLEEYQFIYTSIYDLGGQPSRYSITLPPGLNLRKEIENYVKPFRDDVLNNKVVCGINTSRLEDERKAFTEGQHL